MHNPIDLPFELLAPHLGSVIAYRIPLDDPQAPIQVSGDAEGLIGCPLETLDAAPPERLEALIAKPDRARVKREREKQLRAGDQYSLQYRLLKADGSQCWVRDAGQAQRDGDRSVSRQGLIVDISEQRQQKQRLQQLEQGLEESRSLLQALTDATDLQQLVLDGDAQVVMVNQAWLDYELERGRERTAAGDWQGLDFEALLAANADARADADAGAGAGAGAGADADAGAGAGAGTGDGDGDGASAGGCTGTAANPNTDANFDLGVAAQTQTQTDPALGGQEFADGLRQVLVAEQSRCQLEVADALAWGARWFELSATRLNGDFPGVLVARREITALKKAELELLEQRTFLDSILNASLALGIFAIDRERRIAFFNPAAEAIFGLAKQAAIGRPIEVLSQQMGLPPEPLQQGLSAGQEVSFECAGFPGLPEHVFENRIAPVLAPGGGLLGRVFLAQDVTEQRAYTQRMRQLNEELEARVRVRTRELDQAKKAAEQASQAKSIFLANMSHEIRTPMNAILGMTELVLETALEQQQARLLSSVRSAARSLMNILNDILDVSKLESGRMEIESIPFSLPELASGVTEMIAVNAARKGLEMSLHIDERIPACALGDPTKLRQVLMNLLGNALKFTDHGSIRLEIDLVDEPEPAPDLDSERESEREPVQVHVKVIDTGIGIAAEHLHKIFERFAGRSVDHPSLRRHWAGYRDQSRHRRGDGRADLGR